MDYLDLDVYDEQMYTAEEFKGSMSYFEYKDLLEAVLGPTNLYTKDDVDKLIDEYMNRGV